MVDWADVGLGALFAIPTTIATELILHRLRHRIDRRVETKDAVRELEDALSYVEDAWQSTGGRPSNHQAEEREKRLAEFRVRLNDLGPSLAKTMQRSLAKHYDAMAIAAKAGRSRDVISECRDALLVLDATQQRDREA